MLIFILIFFVIFAAVLLYMAHKSHKLWVQFLIGFGLIFGVAVACTRFGIGVGKAISECDQFAARRMISTGLSAMAEDAKAGHCEALSAKVIYLNEHWYDLDFTLRDDSQSVLELMDFLTDSTTAADNQTDPSTPQ